MSAPVEQRSPVLRFLDAFFQERNIKWMLGIGILVLLGSSLMLVTDHWDDYTPVWKYLILLGYTAGIHGLGQLCYHSLALRKTGTGLMALTVLLIPVTFLAIHWVHPQPWASWSSLFSQVGLLSLLVANIGFSVLAARRIFGHFLRGTQPTFLASYVLLALAGAIVPSLPAGLSLLTALVLWSLFAVGATKVNRHVFWLIEESRLPRAYGFFPILLLGGMFFTLFAVSLAPHIPLAWIGCGLVLTAIPILLTADALARAFQQRHEAMPHPLPWSVVLPMFIGLSLTVAGVCLSGAGFPSTLSLPPTAALAAMVMAVSARRTQKSAFVWLMLAAILAAYQTSPVFFQELARDIVHHGAAAVHEPKLPYAFYGLTYLPLLTVLSGISTMLRRRKEALFSAAFKRFSIGLGLVLLLASVTHVKALFPAGLALSALFGLQLVLFRDRRLLPAGVIAFVLAGAGAQTFVEQVLMQPHSAELPLLAWLITGGLLLWPGQIIDRRTRSHDPAASWWHTAPICQWASLTVLLVTAAAWLVRGAWFGNVATVTGLMCACLLIVHAWQLLNRHVARVAIGNLVLVIAVLAAHHAWPFSVVMALESLLLLGLWLAGRNLRGLQPAGMVEDDHTAGNRVEPVRLLRLAGAEVALVGLGGIAAVHVLPAMAQANLTGAAFSTWLAGAVSLIWVNDAARRLKSPFLTIQGWLLSLGMLGVVAASLFGWGAVFEWYPALGTLLPLLAIGLLRDRDVAAALPLCPVNVLRVCTVATLAVIAVGSLVVFTVPMRVAGAVAITGLLWSASRWSHAGLRTAAYSIAGWSGLTVALQLASPGLRAVNDLSFPLAAATALSVALAAVLLSLLWNSNWMRLRTISEWRRFQCLAFRLVAFAGLLNTLLLHSHKLSAWEAIAAAAAFLLLAVEQLWTARRVATAQAGDPRSLTRCRDEGELHVWLAESVVAAGIAYLLLMRVLTIGGTFSLFAPLMFGTAVWCVGRASLRAETWNVLHRPFVWTGFVLPLLTVFAGLFRHLSLLAPEWMGLNSLALLAAAAFYFWRGLENRTPSLLVVSASILNIASVLLWRELSYSDPQFFMIPLGLSLLGLIELLKPQIDARYVDPLRYLGALTILVSPTYHIVEGSWLHLLTLMVASVLITLAAIGLRVRALMYTGTAFLAADVVAMVVRGSIDNASLLWIAGVLVGAAVIGLAAYCERHREDMLQRLRMIATELDSWE